MDLDNSNLKLLLVWLTDSPLYLSGMGYLYIKPSVVQWNKLDGEKKTEPLEEKPVPVPLLSTTNRTSTDLGSNLCL
jgi:hypothetical protein